MNTTAKIKSENIIYFFPIRRYLARTIDFIICNYIFVFLLSFIYEETSPIYLINIFSFLILIVFEPILITYFSTTPGKFIFNIYVKDKNDNYLSFTDSLIRTISVIIFGMGLNLPAVSTFLCLSNFFKYKALEELIWENRSNVYLVKKNIFTTLFKSIIVLLIIALCIIITIFLDTTSINRGSISVNDFIENYNNFAKKDNYYQLDNYGQPILTEPFTTNIPTFIYTEEDGIMQSLEISHSYDENDIIPREYRNEMIFSIISFAQAQESGYVSSKNTNKIIKKIKENEYSDFQYSINNVLIIYDVEYDGYEVIPSGDSIVLIKSSHKSYFTSSFKMIKN